MGDQYWLQALSSYSWIMNNAGRKKCPEEDPWNIYNIFILKKFFSYISNFY